MITNEKFTFLNKLLEKVSDCGAKTPVIAGGYLRDNWFNKPASDIDLFYEGDLDHPTLLLSYPNASSGKVINCYGDCRLISCININLNSDDDLLLLGTTKLQLLQVKSFKENWECFPCNMSKIMLSLYGMFISNDFISGANTKKLVFTKDVKFEYFSKITRKYSSWQAEIEK